jgi:hypothetical protein
VSPALLIGLGAATAIFVTGGSIAVVLISVARRRASKS